MASIKNGILGGFTGKIGNVVGYSTYGVDRMRSLSDRTAPATAAELRNRRQFKLVQDTLNCIKELIKIGFKNYWTKTGGTRGAISYNKTKAVQLNGDDCAIDPERFRFSGGVLPGLNNVEFELERDDLLRFNWNSALAYGASPKDQVMLLAIDLEEKNACYECLGNFRGSGTDILRLSNDLKGKNLDIYIAVVAKDRSKQSDSQYLGRINIPDPDDDKTHKEDANTPLQVVETLLSEPEQDHADSVKESRELPTIAGNEEAFKQPLIHKTIAVVKARNSETDIRLYIKNPENQGILGPETPSNELPAFIYKADTTSFKHLRFPARLQNHAAIIVSDLNQKLITNHYQMAQKNHLLIICSLFLNSITFSQNQPQKNMIDADKLSKLQLAHMDRFAPGNGWVPMTSPFYFAALSS